MDEPSRELDPETEAAPGVSWNFEIDDEEGTLPTNGHYTACGLLTQPCDGSANSEESTVDNEVSMATRPDAKLHIKHSSETKQSANKRPFAPEEDAPDEFVAAQSKRLFSGTVDRNVDADSSGSGDDSETSDDSSVEEKRESTPIQIRRARNIRRHSEFAKSLNLGGLIRDPKSSPKAKKQKIETTETALHELNGGGLDSIIDAPAQRRGMIFSTKLMNKKHEEFMRAASNHVQSAYATKSVTNELEAKYPTRSLQIKLLSSELEKVVRNTKYAWQNKFSRQKQYSEAKPDSDLPFASPTPILISGSAGTGKSSIVCDTINVLRENIDNISGQIIGKNQRCRNTIISSAYVDCASSSGIDVAFVLNTAFKQLHNCYHPDTAYKYKPDDFIGKDVEGNDANGSNEPISFNDMNLMDYSSDPMEDVDENDDNGIEAEDLIERERNQFRATKGKKGSSRQSLDKKSSERSSKYHRKARDSSRATTKQTDFGYQRSSRHSYDSSPVALFGRAVSVLLQGGLSKKKRPKYGRCSFLVLDNAEQIQSWKKSGSRNALAQLFKLPNVMGINLTVIFISRGSLLTHSGLSTHKSPGMITDAAHPINIHFPSYTDVETMKKILHTSRIQQMITGQSYTFHDSIQCSSYHFIYIQLRDILYKSTMNSFLQIANSYTSDVSEIMRLARLLWLSSIAIFDDKESNHHYQDLAWQLMICLRKENENVHPCCTNRDCSFCNSEAHDDGLELNNIRVKLLEMLDHNVRETMRDLLANVLMMPGRVIEKRPDKPYAERLPYITKFLLLAGFLCQQKRPDQDVNLFTTINTGKRTNRGAKKSDDGTAYAFSTADLKQLRVAKIPSFHVERLLSVFTSIIGQYGHTSLQSKKVGDMGTEEMFKIVSSLIAGGLLRYANNASVNRLVNKSDFMSEKLTCTLSKEEAKTIASSVGFPLDKYCLE